jgi:flagellar assembly factor FliW
MSAALALDFREGLLGFSLCRKWTLLAGKKPGTAWLQSEDRRGLAFMLIDPFRAFEGYTAHLGPAEIERLDAKDPAHIAVFAIVTPPSGDAVESTANLMGPLVINVSAGLGAQVVSDEGRWSVRQPIPQAVLD